MKFSNLTALSRWIFVLLALYFCSALVSAATDFLEVGFLQKMKVGAFASDAEMLSAAQASDDRQRIVGLVSIALFATTALLSLIWTYRASRNAKGLSAMPQRFSPGWSVGWYFVPVASLWQPLRVMNELWQRSAYPATLAGPAALGWWWTLWIGSSLVGGIAARALLRSTDIDTLLAGTWASFFSDIIDLGLVPTYAWIVGTITRMQVAKHAASPDGPSDESVIRDLPEAGETAS